jgi:hypothetical protein
MFRIAVSMALVLMLQMTVACTAEKPPADAQEVKTADEEKRMPRRKIERLDTKTFIELSIDLSQEEAGWRREWENYMQQKRREYYESFGLTERQFTEFAERNSAELQRFLQDNPRYNQALMEAVSPRGRSY